MKRIHIIALTGAVLAIAACNKSNQNQSASVPNEKVTITQASPPPGGTWADVVNATSDGVMMGNPNAKVKLIEIGSLSCPHCMHFEEEGVPALIANYVKPGKVSWEFRTYLIHGPVDMAANLIAHCSGIKTFFPLTEAMYRDQPTWMAKIEAAPQDKLQQITNLPPTQSYVAMANLAGLQDWAAAHGVPHAKSTQCLTDQAMIEHQAQVSVDVNNDYPDFKGTPSFIINGKMLPEDTVSWDKLKPQLDAALNG